MENFSKRSQAALQKPLHQRCEEINKLIDESPTKELHNFFPDLLSSIFGYDGRPDWGLRTLTPGYREYELLRIFLGPHGPMFRLLDKLHLDGHLKYEFYIRLLPLPTQTSLSEGVIPVLYHNKMSSTTAPNLRNNNGVILLDAFEYYMFHFAYYIIYQQTHKVQDSNWMNGIECPYMVILEDYLNYFLPSNGPLVTSTLSSQSPMNLSRNTVWQNGNVYGRPPNLPTQFTGLIRTPSSGHVTTASPGHTSYSHGSGETSRSENFLQILIEFWLNQNTMESVTSNVLSHGQQYFLPGVDLVRVVRMLLKQVHCFVYSTGIESHAQPVTHPEEELKRNIIPQLLQKKLYCFLRLCFAHWPLDPSFRVVIETWLSYIQPWRYAKQIAPIRSEQGGELFTPEWSMFVHENFLFYTALLREFVLRALKLDLFSIKDAFILFRGCKVLSQNILMELIDSSERLLLIPSGGKGSLRGSASNIGMSLGSSLRAHIAELEGPSCVYTSVLQQPGLVKLEELRHLVSSVLAVIRKQQSGGYSDRHPTSAGGGGVAAWFKSVLSGDFLNDDTASRSEKDKLVSYLQQITENLTSIIGVSNDVTNAGDMTIPWATASPVSPGRPLTGVPITPGVTMPEYEQTERGLVLTERGKYQVIMGLRRPEIVFAGDPELQPIRSYENATLVRALYRISMKLNVKLGDTLHQVYNNPGSLGNLACTVSPALTTPSPRSSLGAASTSRSQSPRRPRLSLRYLASYPTMFYLFLLYLLCWLFGLGSLSVFVVFVIVLFGSVIAHVAPAYEQLEPDELQKKLF